MTQVWFHFNVQDKLAYACQLLEQAYGSGQSVTVMAEPDLLAQLDRQLWSDNVRSFVPHCHADEPDKALLAQTPIVLTSQLPSTGADQVLLHLGQTLPLGFETFENLIELVSQQQEDRKQARMRWRHYAQRGYVIESRDMARKEKP